MRNKTKKRGILLSLVALACFSVGAFSACGETASEIPYNGFKEGYAEKIKIGQTMLLEDFIEVADGEEYTLIASNGIEEIDLSFRPTWSPVTAGEWTLTLNLLSGKNKGEYSIKINVTIPSANWNYSTNSLTYAYNTTLKFEDFLDDLMIDVNTINGWDAYVYNVQINGNMIEFDETTTEYTFVDYEPHYFTFGIVTDEGQSCKAVTRVTVQETDVAALNYCEQENIKAYGYQKLYYRGGVFSAQMAAGSYTGYFDNADLPYIAFKGDYGVNSYVSVDFTGKNIPQTAFFCDEITNSLYDQNNGMYISHGVVTNDGVERLKGDWSCLTFFGPLKMRDKHVNTGGSFGREGWESNPSPASRQGLQDGVHYRYIVGYEDLVAGKGKGNGTTTAEQYGSVTVHLLLINLDTNEIVYDYRNTWSASSSNGVLTEEHFTGSIILYANYGINTVWDNIRLVEQNVRSIYDLDSAVSFKTSAPKYALKGDVVNPTDYFTANQLLEGKLYYQHDGGAKYAFDKALTLSEAGSYRITFEPTDSEKRINSTILYVNDSLLLDFEDGITQALQGQFRAGVYLEDKEPFNGEKSAKVVLGNILPLNDSRFGLRFTYLDKVFSDPMVDNVIVPMCSDTSVVLNCQNGWDSNGNRQMAPGGINLDKGKIVFVPITRENYEVTRKKETYGMYLFSVPALSNTVATPQLNVVIDDITTGLVHGEGSFVYQEGVNLSYTFNGTVDAFYLGGKEIVDGDGVTIVGNQVTVSSALLVDKQGEKIQLAVKTENGIEIVDQKIVSELFAYVIKGTTASTSSSSKITLGIDGIVSSVKVDGTEVPFEQVATNLSIKKIDLAPFANGKQKNIVITTDKGEVRIPITLTLTDINKFEKDETLFTAFEGENVGKMEIVGKDVITPFDGEGSYRIELPDIGEGYHKVTIPFELIDEAFSQPYVNAMYFYVTLSYDEVRLGVDRISGKSVSPAYDYYYMSKGMANKFKNDAGSFNRRVAIDYNTYMSLKLTEHDYSIYVDAASHAGKVEYLYIDNMCIAGHWASSEFTLTADNDYTIAGLFGDVISVKRGQGDRAVDVIAMGEVTIKDNTISIPLEQLSKFQGSDFYTVETSEGVTYSLIFSAEQ